MNRYIRYIDGLNHHQGNLILECIVECVVVVQKVKHHPPTQLLLSAAILLKYSI